MRFSGNASFNFGVACKVQVSSLTFACSYLYWLYDRFIMEDEHRANEVCSLSHSILQLLLPSCHFTYFALADATGFHSWRCKAHALHLATHGHWPAVI
jgi:hypothetical protein